MADRSHILKLKVFRPYIYIHSIQRQNFIELTVAKNQSYKVSPEYISVYVGI
jgi:hypothetical protein